MRSLHRHLRQRPVGKRLNARDFMPHPFREAVQFLPDVQFHFGDNEASKGSFILVDFPHDLVDGPNIPRFLNPAAACMASQIVERWFRNDPLNFET